MRKLKLLEKKLNDVCDMANKTMGDASLLSNKYDSIFALLCDVQKRVEKLEKVQESLDDDVFDNRKNITELFENDKIRSKEIEDLILGRQGVDEWILRCEKKMKELERKQKRYFELLEEFKRESKPITQADQLKTKNDGWMRANKAAEKYDVNPKTLYGLVKKGKLKKRKFEDNSVWVLEDEVKRYSEFRRLGS